MGRNTLPSSLYCHGSDDYNETLSQVYETVRRSMESKTPPMKSRSPFLTRWKKCMSDDTTYYDVDNYKPRSDSTGCFTIASDSEDDCDLHFGQDEEHDRAHLLSTNREKLSIVSSIRIKIHKSLRFVKTQAKTMVPTKGKSRYSASSPSRADHYVDGY